MRLSLFIVICTLSFFIGNAQNKQISGVVVDSLQNPVSFANIIAYYIQKDTTLLAFTQTHEKGQFNLVLADTLQEITLRVSLLGYQDYWKNFVISSNNFVLSEPIILLSIPVQFQDVFVIDKRTFNASGDTLTINANAFKDSTEKNIEDLLKKIPGFNVNEKGEIYFKNKKIERIAIEGDDITKQNYSVISRNFSAKPVQDIQIISNYSENPLLASVNGQNKETILNLRLDNKYKNIWSKQIDLYAVYPFMYEVYISASMISKSLKTINFIDANTTSNYKINTSILPSKDNFFSTLYPIEHQWINLYQIPISDILPLLYQNYQGYSINTATHYRLNDKTTLKFTGYGNSVQQYFTEKQYLQNMGIFITGEKTNTQLQKIPFGDIEFSHFPNKKHFFTYTSTYKRTQIQEKENQFMNIFHNQAYLNTKNTFHTHQLSYTHKIKQKYVLRHQANYTCNKQNLTLTLQQFPAQKFPITEQWTDTIQQFLSTPQSAFFVQSDVFTGKTKYSVGYNHFSQNIHSTIHTKRYDTSSTKGDFINENQYLLHTLCFSVYREYQWKKFSLRAEFKPYFAKWFFKDSIVPQKHTVITILPNLNLQYRHFSLSYQYYLKPLGIQSIYKGYTFSNTRNLQRGAGLLYPTYTHITMLTHNFDNYKKGIMLQNSFSYSIQKGLLAAYTQIDSIYVLSQTYSQKTIQNQMLLQSIISKVFFEHRWAINFVLFAFQNEYQNYLYGLPLYTTQRLISAQIKAYLLPRKVFYLGLGSKIQHLQTQNRFIDFSLVVPQKAYQIVPYTDMYFSYKVWKFSTQTQYFLNYNNYFTTPFLLPWVNIECAYFDTKKNYNWSIKCENLFNHEQWLTNSIAVFSNTQSFIPLRGRLYRINFTYTF